MCFLVDENSKDPFIAEKDIICYKTGKSYWFGWFSPTHYHKFKYWRFISTKKVELLPQITWRNTTTIEEGYHAYINIPSNYSIRKLKVMVIPAGTKYYINKKDNEYVAEKMMYIGRYKGLMAKMVRKILS
jgi:hypothetical protein